MTRLLDAWSELRFGDAWSAPPAEFANDVIKVVGYIPLNIPPEEFADIALSRLAQ